jgi:hypothetical protein
MISLTAAAVADVVRERCGSIGAELSVLWCATTQSRTAFARDIECALGPYSAAAVVVSRVRFDDPNAVLEDLVRLIEESRSHIMERLAADGLGRLRALVLVSRRELEIPQLASPAILPEWLPEVGGTTVSVSIEDITWTACVPLADLALDVEGLASALYDVDMSCLDRLESVSRLSPRSTQALFDRIRREDREALYDFCAAAREALSRVKNPSRYRPSVKSGTSLIARLWSVAQAESPDRRGKRIARSLATALAIADLDRFPPEPLVSVMARPATRPNSESERYVLGLINAIVAACQLTTAAAHSDDYPGYPPALLHSLSLDLQASLRAAVNLLSDVPLPNEGRD